MWQESDLLQWKFIFVNETMGSDPGCSSGIRNPPPHCCVVTVPQERRGFFGRLFNWGQGEDKRSEYYDDASAARSRKFSMGEQLREVSEGVDPTDSSCEMCRANSKKYACMKKLLPAELQTLSNRQQRLCAVRFLLEKCSTKKQSGKTKQPSDKPRPQSAGSDSSPQKSPIQATPPTCVCTGTGAKAKAQQLHICTGVEDEAQAQHLRRSTGTKAQPCPPPRPKITKPCPPKSMTEHGQDMRDPCAGLEELYRPSGRQCGGTDSPPICLMLSKSELLNDKILRNKLAHRKKEICEKGLDNLKCSKGKFSSMVKENSRYRFN